MLRNANVPSVCPAPPPPTIVPTYQVWWLRPFGRTRYTARAQFTSIDMDLAVAHAQAIVDGDGRNDNPYDPTMHYVYMLVWDGHLPPHCGWDSLTGADCTPDAHRQIRRLVAAE